MRISAYMARSDRGIRWPRSTLRERPPSARAVPVGGAVILGVIRPRYLLAVQQQPKREASSELHGAKVRHAPCRLRRCDGSGWLVDERTRTASPCECRAEALARARGAGGLPPKRYRGAAWDRPPITLMDRGVVVHARRWASRVLESVREGHGLWLAGPKKAGKTWLLALLARTAFEQQEIQVQFAAWSSTARELRKAAAPEGQRRPGQLLDVLARCDLLVLDDLTEDGDGWVASQLDILIDMRWEQCLATLVSSDVPDLATLEERVPARVASRLSGMCGVPLWCESLE